MEQITFISFTACLETSTPDSTCQNIEHTHRETNFKNIRWLISTKKIWKCSSKRNSDPNKHERRKKTRDIDLYLTQSSRLIERNMTVVAHYSIKNVTNNDHNESYFIKSSGVVFSNNNSHFETSDTILKS